jgi:F0F1-type ATP synthase assembly protein I
MKDTILRLLIVHAVVLALAGIGASLVWGGLGAFSAVAGVSSFSLPVLAFSGLVLRASQGDTSRFIGRFMAAEALKWVSAAALLALSFVSGVFSAQALLAGFLLSVLVQVFFPIFVRKESET